MPPAAAGLLRTDTLDARSSEMRAPMPGTEAPLNETLERMQAAPTWVAADCLVAWTLRGLAQGTPLRRVAWLSADLTMRVVRTRHLQVAPGVGAAGWSGFRFPLDGTDLFARLLGKPQALWAGGANRQAIDKLLNPAARALLGGAEFLAMSVHVGGEPRGLVLADCGPSSATPEALYAPFKTTCLTLGARLATAPAPLGPTEAARAAAASRPA
ncbi:MAG: hypothetical protein MUF30_12810 [Burkholderiales bacterium]|nr:hypothetical protein [Burkholderiales bacterium]